MDTQTNPKKDHLVRNIIVAIAAIALIILEIFSYMNPELFKAELTGGTDDASVNTDLYISNDYRALAGESHYITVKAGKALTNLRALKITFTAATSMVEMVKVDTDGTVLESISHTESASIPGQYTVAFGTFSPIASVSDNAVLFKLMVSLKSGLQSGNTVVISRVDNSFYSFIDDDTAGARKLSFRDGMITVGAGVDACENIQCGVYGVCRSGECICDIGYTGVRCNACDAAHNYTGYPNCKIDLLSDIGSVILTLSQDTISKLDTADRIKAYSSAYVMINSSTATGTITLEGQPAITIPAPTSGITEAEKITSITDQLKTLLTVTGVNVTKISGAPGLLKLEAVSPNTDMSLDGISTTSGDVTIVPEMKYKLTLTPPDTYQLRVIGKNSDGSDVPLNFNDVKLMPQPVNILDDSALAGGLLKKGDASGTATLYAEVEKSDGSTIKSNLMTIEVPSGPIIEYARIIGSNAIERGGRVNLSVKISDVDQISDIKDISTSIVRSSQTTYAGISSDASAVWFTATPVITEVAATENGTQETPAEGEEVSPPAPPVTENYRIYTIPVEVPQDANLTDGPYKLLLEITDTANHVATSVLPITIGAVASGDVNGDSNISMLDVIMAFQIANGSTTPTQAQLNAADMNGDGRVTMLDVITLFNKI